MLADDSDSGKAILFDHINVTIGFEKPGEGAEVRIIKKTVDDPKCPTLLCCGKPMTAKEASAAMTEEGAREAVKGRYDACAERGAAEGGVCCAGETPASPSFAAEHGLYSREELLLVPEIAFALSRGCGHPETRRASSDFRHRLCGKDQSRGPRALPIDLGGMRRRRDRRGSVFSDRYKRRCDASAGSRAGETRDGPKRSGAAAPARPLCERAKQVERRWICPVQVLESKDHRLRPRARIAEHLSLRETRVVALHIHLPSEFMPFRNLKRSLPVVRTRVVFSPMMDL